MEVGHVSARLDRLRVGNPLDEVVRSVRKQTGNERTPGPVNQRWPDEAVRPPYARNHVATAASIALDELVAETGIATGHDPRAGRSSARARTDPRGQRADQSDGECSLPGGAGQTCSAHGFVSHRQPTSNAGVPAGDESQLANKPTATIR